MFFAFDICDWFHNLNAQNCFLNKGLIKMISKVRKAVFPVAGFGTRFLPATKAMPKELLPIIDKPLIQYAVEEAIMAAYTRSKEIGKNQ